MDYCSPGDFSHRGSWQRWADVVEKVGELLSVSGLISSGQDLGPGISLPVVGLLKFLILHIMQLPHVGCSGVGAWQAFGGSGRWLPEGTRPWRHLDLLTSAGLD